eukprot:m51a1_g3986 putative glycoside hydrolase (447) ;mRNA; r:483714-485176
MRSSHVLAVVAFAGLAAAIQSSNPYALGKSVVLNSVYVAEVTAAGVTNPSMKAKFDVVKKYPTFLWLDTIAMLDKLPAYLATAKSEGKMAQIVVYDLPNRDCAALASNGELLVNSDGLNRYKTEYIDKLATILNEYSTVPVVMVIEPDSLPNMVTNKEKTTSCQIVAASDPSIYHQGVAYAIKTLKASNRYMYIDAAHECWLGWDNNMAGFLTVINSVMSLAGDTTSVRGFSTNVANYQTLVNTKGCGDSNPIYGHLSYVQTLYTKFQNGVFGSDGPHFIVDTSRNGATDQRTDVGNWCNINGAGLGARPKASPNSAYSMIDAYTWIKPPGESDGTSNTSATRYDAKCNSADSMSNAPEAGTWFQTQFEMLVKNANPAVSTDSTTSSATTTVSSTTTTTTSSKTTQSSGKTTKSSSKKSTKDDSLTGTSSTMAIGAAAIAAVAGLF